MPDKKTVLVGLSGGVDSSVAAALLLRQGYAVIGITMAIWSGESCAPEGKKHGCYGPGEEEDIEDAKKVCNKLGIPYHVVDLKKEYKNIVLDYFSDEYTKGRTPNPCIVCNRYLKFDYMLQKAQQSGISYDYFATGHYVQVVHDKKANRYLLKKGKDDTKDQSYFLYTLSQQQLSQCLFPVGSYKKTEIKNIAEKLNLGLHDKPESQNFISGDYSPLSAINDNPGAIVDTKGNVLGKHTGIHHYTIGQRKGLGIAYPEPLYVIALNAAENKVIVGIHDDIYGDSLIASKLNWIAIEKLNKPIKAKAKIRYQHDDAACTIDPTDEDTVKVVFSKPQMSITPGQSVVFYNKDIVLGGGIISIE